MTTQQKQITAQVTREGETIINGFLYRLSSYQLQNNNTVIVLEQCIIRTIADHKINILVKFWGV